MKYVCLAFEVEAKFHAMSLSEWDALRQQTLAYVDSLRERGQRITAKPLTSAGIASTVQIRDGKESNAL